MERESLYAAICANPRDDLPKLVFADWLDERGDAVDRAHAELIRIQCEWESNKAENQRLVEPFQLNVEHHRWPNAKQMTAESDDAARAIQLLNRSADLELITKDKPLMPLPEFSGAMYHFSNRVHGIKQCLRMTSLSTWENHLSDIRKHFPIRDLILDPYTGSYQQGDGVSDVESELFSQIESLSSEMYHSTTSLRSILGWRKLHRLRRFSCKNANANSTLIEALSNADHLPELESLQLDCPSYSSSAFLNVERFPKLQQLSLWSFDTGSLFATMSRVLEFTDNCLRELDLQGLTDHDDNIQLRWLDGNRIPKLARLVLGGMLARSTVGQILSSGQFPELRHLHIFGHFSGDFVGRVLEKARSHPMLDSLTLGQSGLERGAVGSLVRWPGFVNLRKLELEGSRLNHEAIAALGSADAPHLRTLGLANCNLHGSHVRELTQSRFVRSLWNLDLHGNEVDDAFIRALVETPFLDELQCLLIDLPEDDPGYARLKARFGDRFQSA